MTLIPCRFTEMPLRSSSSLPLASTSRYYFSSSPSSSAAPKQPFHFTRTFSSSLRTIATTTATGDHHRNHQGKYPSVGHRNPNSAPPWIDKWPPSPSSSAAAAPVAESDDVRRSEAEAEARMRYLERDRGQSAIERIVLRLRNLGLGSEGEDEEEDEINGGDETPVTGEERLGDLLKREWIRPDMILAERDGNNEDDMLLPWEKDDNDDVAATVAGRRRIVECEDRVMVKKRGVTAPTLAELTIEDSELRRLRRNGMYLRERINIPKAGLTKAVMEKIHDNWRKNELVRLKFHEVLARDMKTAHEIVERRTGGLVIWRSGSVMVVYRGSNYEGSFSRLQTVDEAGETLFVPDVSSSASIAPTKKENNATLMPETSKAGTIRNQVRPENMTEEEAEFNSLLDSLGPRFHEWWGTGILPVDADLLPQKIPGYKTPFRLLPTGMRSRLTNAEMTNLRKLAKALPCHFALGRNRNHQGLAAAIIKLWEKSLVVKIAVKRGIQNTNNKLMADEIKKLTGGVLLLRNKYYIVIYRGKDFLPPSVAATLAERQEITKQIQDVEERVRNQGVEVAQSIGDAVQAQAGTLTEFYEAQSRWGREISPDEREKMVEEAARAERARVVRRIEHKLSIAQAKMLRAEKLLSKIETSMVPSGPDYDQEIVTDEERVMFRRVGLRMKAYLPIGIRGVFDGVIENMHLHWKHRELVKLISKQKNLAFVEDTARLLEYESGGVLVAIEKVPKGFALIYYRGKNYRRPISLRPRNLLTKAKALKRSVAMQRHEALSQHISQLENTIEQMKKELNEDKPSYEEFDSDDENEDDDTAWEENEESAFSSLEDDDNLSTQNG